MKTGVGMAIGMLLLTCMFVIAAGVRAEQAPEAPKATSRPGESVVVGLVDHGDDARTKCIDSSFLGAVDRESTVRVARAFVHVKLSDDAVFGYPFIFLNGEGTLAFSEAERSRLAAYLKRGGFLLASTRCADAKWSADFRNELLAILPRSELKPVEMDHPMFHTLYDIQVLRTRQAMDKPVKLEALEIDGRVAVVFSSLGLNGTDDVGGECCCCGGNEIRDAKRVNADLLLYALTR